ncbi:Patellin-5 -like protein [Gossypium arboreum]|uniref:Patellin-5-like protein n=1 Tax=Gossypium arboreum TaxID=29729 RepID=A0A0B0MHZ6_GOSAR|nr:Patellin-5 -like protein [Gossypium arboreum]
MAEETQKPEAAAAPSPAEEVVVEKESEQEAAPEKPADAVVEDKPAEAVEEEPKVEAKDTKVTESASFKEETNIAGELPDPQKKALDELKQLIQEALNKHEFTPPPAKDKDKPAPEEKKEEDQPATSAAETEVKVETEAPAPVEVKEEEKADPLVEAPAPVEVREEEKADPPIEAPAPETVVETEVVEKVSAADDDEVSIWGIPLLADERSDVILLKFLRARDFKVKDAFTMIKNTVIWRKEFGVDGLLDEELGNELEKVVFMHGFDKEGHPVCYNVYGEFQNKELYQNTFADEEKRSKFLRWRIQFLEKSIRKLDFSPNGISTIVQVNDLKNSPGPGKRELRQATNQALHLLQDNYPEFVAKQVFINVPWWYLAFNMMISPFLTQRTKSKYIAPEQVPVQYGGLSRDGEQEFTVADAATEVTIKPATKHSVEFPVTEKSTVVWEVRVVGWDVNYGAEFVPTAEDGYTVIVSKTRKVGPADETVISNSFKTGEPGKIVLTIDNQTTKKKKLVYRSKAKPYSE